MICIYNSKVDISILYKKISSIFKKKVQCHTRQNCSYFCNGNTHTEKLINLVTVTIKKIESSEFESRCIRIFAIM